MKTDNLDHLIEQYFAAETKESEELDLRSYALSDGNDAPEELKILFEFFESEKDIQTELEIDIPQEEEKEAKIRTISWRRPLIAVAASLVVLIGIFTVMNRDKSNSGKNLGFASSSRYVETAEYNVESEDEALQIVFSSLGLVSESINTGIGISQQGVKETEVFQLIKL